MGIAPARAGLGDIIRHRGQPTPKRPPRVRSEEPGGSLSGALAGESTGTWPADLGVIRLVRAGPIGPANQDQSCTRVQKTRLGPKNIGHIHIARQRVRTAQHNVRAAQCSLCTAQYSVCTTQNSFRAAQNSIRTTHSVEVFFSPVATRGLPRTASSHHRALPVAPATGCGGRRRAGGRCRPQPCRRSVASLRACLRVCHAHSLELLGLSGIPLDGKGSEHPPTSERPGVCAPPLPFICVLSE